MIKNIKGASAWMLAAMMAVTMAGCGSNSESKKVEETTEEVVQEEVVVLQNAVQEGVTVPDQFDTMLYPMEALAMESYHLGYPYYVQFSEGSSRDSFWYSTALTAYYLHPDAKERIQVSQEECDSIVGALYASYQDGNLEIPEIRDGVSYVAYDDEGDGYYVSVNDSDYVPAKLSDYYLNVTACDQNGDEYVVKAELMDGSLGSSLGEFEYTLVINNNTEGDKGFAYSISSMSDGTGEVISADGESAENSQESTVSAEEATDEDGNPIEVLDDGSETEEQGEEYSDESTDDASYNEDVETEEEQETDPSGEGAANGDSANADEEENLEEVSSDRAMMIAQENYGGSNQYSYEGIEKLDGYPYHVFSVSGDPSISYVLVGTNGIDCVGANRNEDGSWSFDQ